MHQLKLVLVIHICQLTTNGERFVSLLSINMILFFPSFLRLEAAHDGPCLGGVELGLLKGSWWSGEESSEILKSSNLFDM